ncbi:hypothetical protein MKW94_013581 [Papaver nudicaule]|uniref:Uncharacterized protein n=1 Tax=Papaver nudicaule TaxID=74823 RepID=A0AA41VWM5_PAPNU|nr:hypothetical protein [Papaver nudicaule]
MQALSRGVPYGGVVVSPLPNQRIMVVKPYSNLIRFSSSPFKISSTHSLPISKLRVCNSLKLIPSAAKQTSMLMITELTSLIPHQIKLFLKVILAFGLFRVVLEQIHKLYRWDFLDVNDLITTQFGGKQIFGFVESIGWFGITIKMKNGERVFISKRKSNGVITKFDHQMKNGEHVNWRFTTELEIEMDQVDGIRKEIYKIFQEDKDLEQEDSYVVVLRFNFVIRTAVLLVSCFTKTGTHEEYFTIRDALLSKLHNLMHTG